MEVQGTKNMKIHYSRVKYYSHFASLVMSTYSLYYDNKNQKKRYAVFTNNFAAAACLNEIPALQITDLQTSFAYTCCTSEQYFVVFFSR